MDLYSLTSSAQASKRSGTVSPSALAVLGLTIKFTLVVGCTAERLPQLGFLAVGSEVR
jgi:hypothetical protein